jgi:hypothetical protein
MTLKIPCPPILDNYINIYDIINYFSLLKNHIHGVPHGFKPD